MQTFGKYINHNNQIKGKCAPREKCVFGTKPINGNPMKFALFVLFFVVVEISKQCTIVHTYEFLRKPIAYGNWNSSSWTANFSMAPYLSQYIWCSILHTLETISTKWKDSTISSKGKTPRIHTRTEWNWRFFFVALSLAILFSATNKSTFLIELDLCLFSVFVLVASSVAVNAMETWNCSY